MGEKSVFLMLHRTTSSVYSGCFSSGAWKARDRSTRRLLFICRFLQPFQHSLSGIGSTSSASCRAAGGAEGGKETSDVAGDKEGATETPPPHFSPGWWDRGGGGPDRLLVSPSKSEDVGGRWCLTLSSRAWEILKTTHLLSRLILQPAEFLRRRGFYCVTEGWGMECL